MALNNLNMQIKSWRSYEKNGMNHWDLDNSYYQLKVKLPKNMTFDKEELTYKWNLDKSGAMPMNFWIVIRSTRCGYTGKYYYFQS